MKDAKGHGSDARGMASAATAGNHQSGVLRLGRPGGAIRVKELNTQRVGIGNSPWQTVGRYRNQAVAERQAQYARVDKGETLVRVTPPRDTFARVKNLGRTAP